MPRVQQADKMGFQQSRSPRIDCLSRKRGGDGSSPDDKGVTLLDEEQRPIAPETHPAEQNRRLRYHPATGRVVCFETSTVRCHTVRRVLGSFRRNWKV